MRSRPLAVLLLGSLLCGLACTSTGSETTTQPLRTLRRNPEKGKPNFMGLPLRTGQIVLTEAPGPLSFFFNLAPSHFYRFTHVAILVMEDNKPYVYDIVGELSTMEVLYSEKPTDAISGKVRRNFFYDYCKPNLYVEVFDPPQGVDTKKVAAYLQNAYDREQAFDPYFDIDNHDQVFCSEMAELALKEGGLKSIPYVTLNPNKSLHVALRWLGIPLTDNLPAGVFADPARSVGALGTFNSMNSVNAYYAAKQEIYERFTEDQKLGNIFRLDGLEINLRDEVDLFVRESIKLFARSRQLLDQSVIQQAVRELADEKLGFYPRKQKPRGKAPRLTQSPAKKTSKSRSKKPTNKKRP